MFAGAGWSFDDPRKATCAGEPIRMFKVRCTWTGIDASNPTIERAAIDSARRMNASYPSPRYQVVDTILLSNGKWA
jgi:hypothetical protein